MIWMIFFSLTIRYSVLMINNGVGSLNNQKTVKQYSCKLCI